MWYKTLIITIYFTIRCAKMSKGILASSTGVPPNICTSCKVSKRVINYQKMIWLNMGKARYTWEQIIVKLRGLEVLCIQGKIIAEVSRQAGITEQTYYRWRKEFGSMRTSEAKRIKELKKENARLKNLVAEQAFDISILKDVTLKKLLSSAKQKVAVRYVIS